MNDLLLQRLKLATRPLKAAIENTPEGEIVPLLPTVAEELLTAIEHLLQEKDPR